ncbi:aminotransferase class IV [Neolewinella sp.]|uniref:aminotransferase class IV n=1 Tax=Neolewinella sp. TaxID=2993543 RepID=UPI003B5156A5
MLDTVYVNDRFLPSGAAQLPVSDLSILRGYGVFDYFRFAGGKPRFLDDHLARLQDSIDALHLELKVTDRGLTDIVHELIERNGGGDGGIRIVVTGGLSADGYTPTAPTLLLLGYPHLSPPTERYAMGCHCMLHHYERQLPRVKSIDYLEGIRIQPLLQQRGAQYPLYVDRDGLVRESDRSNFLIVHDGSLVTPYEDILLGITRKHLLKLARQLNIPVEERAVSVAELLGADEAILCSTVKGALPITRVDGKEIGAGAAGATTRKLMQAWAEYR